MISAKIQDAGMITCKGVEQTIMSQQSDETLLIVEKQENVAACRYSSYWATISISALYKRIKLQLRPACMEINCLQ